MIPVTTAAASKECQNNRDQSGKEYSVKEALREVKSHAQQVLAEAIARGQVGPEGLLATRVQVLHLFGRIERLGGQIDQAFGGQAFLPNVGPASPANRRRFNAYFACQKAGRTALRGDGALGDDLWHEHGGRLGFDGDCRHAATGGRRACKREPGSQGRNSCVRCWAADHPSRS